MSTMSMYIMLKETMRSMSNFTTVDFRVESDGIVYGNVNGKAFDFNKYTKSVKFVTALGHETSKRPEHEELATDIVLAWIDGGERL